MSQIIYFFCQVFRTVITLLKNEKLNAVCQSSIIKTIFCLIADGHQIYRHKKNYKYTQGSGLTAGENTFMKTTVTPFCCNNFTYFSNSEQCSRFDVFFLNP